MLAACAIDVAIGAESDVGSIRGYIATDDLQWRNAGAAVVVLCDAKSGLPLIAETRGPLTRSDFDGPEDLWHAVGSGFEFKDVPPGEYKLIAQAWSGTAGMPSMERPSSIVMLLGTRTAVKVEAGQATETPITPLGDRQLSVSLDPDAEGSFVFVSTTPMRTDPILGFLGWGDEYLRNIVAAAHHSQPRLTFIGLPSDCELHVGVFAYDNLPGVGGAVVRADQREVTVPIYAGWSDGKTDPPPRLLPLVEYLEKSGSDWTDVAQIQPPPELGEKEHHLDESIAWEIGFDQAEREVQVGDLGKVAVKDVMAADRYRMLRKYRQQRQQRQLERAKQRSESTAPTEAR
jgi:hypothetical protein